MMKRPWMIIFIASLLIAPDPVSLGQEVSFVV